jgi:GTP cyclohydrolase I
MGYSKLEQYDDQTTLELQQHYKNCLGLLGENAEREGLLKTPERVAKAMQFLMHMRSSIRLNFMRMSVK